MKKLAVTAVIFLLLSTTGVMASEEMFTIAVMPFEKGGVTLEHYYGSRLLDGLTQMITDRLAREPDIQVLERSRIEQIFAEQELQRSDWVDQSATVKLGRLLGAQMLVFGTLTDFGLKKTGGISFGPLSVSGTKATVGFSARVVNAESGLILGSISAFGEHTGSSFQFSDINGLSFGTSEFSETTLGKAFDVAIEDFVAKLTPVLNQAKSKIASASDTVWAQIISIAGDFAVINLGSQDGVRQGMVFRVYRLLTVEGLRDPVRIPLGRLRIVSTDPEASVGVAEGPSRISDFEVGNIVERE